MISDVYARLIFLDLLSKRFLELGRSPGLENLRSLENQSILLNAGENGSRVRYEPEWMSEGSAARIMKTLDTFIMEMKTIQTAGDEIKARGRRIFDRANNNIALVGRDANNATLELCTFELARQNGMHLSNYDSFASLSKIDQQQTTAEFNSAAQTASLKKRPFATKHDLTHLKAGAFEVLVVNGPYLGLNLARGSSFLHMTDDSESYWVHQLVARESGEKTLALQVDLGEALTVSRVGLTPLEADSEDGVGLRVLTSPDGTKWQEMAPKRFYKAEAAEIAMTPSVARYIRLEMTRRRPSFELNRGETVQVYEFGLDNLEVWETKYYPRADVVTKPIQLIEKLTRVSQPINRVRVDASDERPPGTDIIYYISTANDVNLLTRIEPGQEISLNTVIENREDQVKVKSRYDANHALVDLELNDDFIQESVRMFRNTYQPGVIIDGVPSGWKFNNSYYSCVFEIEQESEINLGINFAFINGEKRNGINILEPGFYEFRTHEVNWKVAESETNDPLFPHNHKLIIEGIPGSTVYPGASFVAAEELKMVAAFDLIKNIDHSDTRFFAVRERSPLIKIDQPPVLTDTIEGWRFEQHAVRYKYKSADVTQVTSITLVAKMTSTNERFTPLLKGYVVIAGF
jgi:hypothetical protein